MAQQLPPGVAAPLGHAIRVSEPGKWSQLKWQVQGVVAHPQFRDRVGAFIDGWRSLAPHLDPVSVAAAIEAAVYCAEAARKSQTLELVWTGPQSDTALRRTDQALLQLTDSAREELYVISFAVYNIPEIRTALVRAAERGVHLRIVIESPQESAGKVTYDGLKALGTNIATLASVYRWPKEKRAVDASGKHGSLHAKCAVADAQALLISSANLTEYAMTLNMEMGILVRGGSLPAQVSQHFSRLIADGVLVEVK